MKDASKGRILVSWLLKNRTLVLTRAVSAGGRFSSFREMERAEKRFLLAFLTSLVGSTSILASNLWDLNLRDLAAMPIRDLVLLVTSVAMILSSVTAILSYLSIGFVIQRAVEIKPREERE